MTALALLGSGGGTTRAVGLGWVASGPGMATTSLAGATTPPVMLRMAGGFTLGGAAFGATGTMAASGALGGTGTMAASGGAGPALSAMGGALECQGRASLSIGPPNWSCSRTGAVSAAGLLPDATPLGRYGISSSPSVSDMVCMVSALPMGAELISPDRGGL